ncbi:MAG TPA: hypothetical protein VJL60_00205, partial [Gammaproteobacteria bacterium]|nr:hypothetical protein [Gammaproteobacteria bacterium]
MDNRSAPPPYSNTDSNQTTAQQVQQLAMQNEQRMSVTATNNNNNLVIRTHVENAAGDVTSTDITIRAQDLLRKRNMPYHYLDGFKTKLADTLKRTKADHISSTLLLAFLKDFLFSFTLNRNLDRGEIAVAVLFYLIDLPFLLPAFTRAADDYLQSKIVLELALEEKRVINGNHYRGVRESMAHKLAAAADLVTMIILPAIMGTALAEGDTKKAVALAGGMVGTKAASAIFTFLEQKRLAELIHGKSFPSFVVPYSPGTRNFLFASLGVVGTGAILSIIASNLKDQSDTQKWPKLTESGEIVTILGFYAAVNTLITYAEDILVRSIQSRFTGDAKVFVKDLLFGLWETRKSIVDFCHEVGTALMIAGIAVECDHSTTVHPATIVT